MPTNQASSNIAFKQGGNELLLGGSTNHPIAFGYDDLYGVVGGALNPSYVAFGDDFLGDTINATWQTDLSSGATIAINAQAGGVIRFATSTTDTNHATLALGIHFKAGQGDLIVEARVSNVSAITNRALEFGLSDTVSETNGLAFSSHDATPVDVAADAIVFGYNTDDSMTAWSALSVNTGGTPQYNDTAIAPTAGTFQVLRIMVDSSRNATFFIDGVLVATHSVAVAAVNLTPWVTVATLTTGDRQFDLDYVNVVGAR